MTPDELGRLREHSALLDRWRPTDERARYLVDAYQNYSADPYGYAARSAAATAAPVALTSAAAIAGASRIFPKAKNRYINESAQLLADHFHFLGGDQRAFSLAERIAQKVVDAKPELQPYADAACHTAVRIPPTSPITKNQVVREFVGSGMKPDQAVRMVQDDTRRKAKELELTLAHRLESARIAGSWQHGLKKYLPNFRRKAGLVAGIAGAAGLVGALTGMRKLRKRTEMSEEDAAQFLSERDIGEALSRGRTPLSSTARGVMATLLGAELAGY